MKIASFKINNLFSFSIYNNKLKLSDFNLIIGPNNEGKSNLLKAIQFIGAFIDIHVTKVDFLNNHIPLAKLTEKLPFLKEEEDLFFEQDVNNEITFSFELQFTDNEIKKLISGLKSDDIGDNDPHPSYLSFLLLHENVCAPENEKSIEIVGKIYSLGNREISTSIRSITLPNNSNTDYSTLFNADESTVLQLVKGRFDDKAYSVRKVSEEIFRTQMNDKIKPLVNQFLINLSKAYLKKIKFIPAIRTVRDFSYDSEKNHPELSHIVEKLMALRDGMHNERNRFSEVKEFVRKLVYPKIAISQIEITFPRKDEFHLLKLNISDTEDGKDKILPLSQLGSGVEQLFYLAASILIEENNCFFLIEEPETNFHPKLQRKLIRFLQNDLINKDHQFFITSHSSVFVEPFMTSNKSKVFQVKFHDEYNESRIISLNEKYNINKISDLLFELGVRGTDLLQTNGIIWVEGPSDRVYILKWLELYKEAFKQEDIIEGRDFSVLFYGGSVLSSFSMEEDLIDEHELKDEEDDFISMLKINRNSVVVMDRDLESGKKWDTKKRIEKEMSSYDHGFPWITDGKEIENYLSGTAIEKSYPGSLIKAYKTNATERAFERWLKSRNIYINKKMFAKKVCKNIDSDEIESNPLLLDKIKRLYETIKQWN